jgi:hypothetical protein
VNRLDDLLARLDDADREKLAFASRQKVKRVTTESPRLQQLDRCPSLGSPFHFPVEGRKTFGRQAGSQLLPAGKGIGEYLFVGVFEHAA